MRIFPSSHRIGNRQHPITFALTLGYWSGICIHRQAASTPGGNIISLAITISKSRWQMSAHNRGKDAWTFSGFCVKAATNFAHPSPSASQTQLQRIEQALCKPSIWYQLHCHWEKPVGQPDTVWLSGGDLPLLSAQEQSPPSLDHQVANTNLHRPHTPQQERSENWTVCSSTKHHRWADSLRLNKIMPWTSSERVQIDCLSFRDLPRAWVLNVWRFFSHCRIASVFFWAVQLEFLVARFPTTLGAADLWVHDCFAVAEICQSESGHFLLFLDTDRPLLHAHPMTDRCGST